MTRWIAISMLLVAVGCGKGKPSPAEPEPAAAATEPAPAAATEPAPATETAPGITSCEDACMENAMCYEEIYGEDYRQGGACVDSCEERTDAERATYFTCLDRAADCNATMNC